MQGNRKRLGIVFQKGDKVKWSKSLALGWDIDNVTQKTNVVPSILSHPSITYTCPLLPPSTFGAFLRADPSGILFWDSGQMLAGGTDTELQVNKDGYLQGIEGSSWKNNTLQIPAVDIVSGQTNFKGVKYMWPSAKPEGTSFLRATDDGCLFWDNSEVPAGGHEDELQYNHLGKLNGIPKSNWKESISTLTLPKLSLPDPEVEINGICYRWPEKIKSQHKNNVLTGNVLHDGDVDLIWSSVPAAGDIGEIQINKSGKLSSKASLKISENTDQLISHDKPVVLSTANPNSMVLHTLSLQGTLDRAMENHIDTQNTACHINALTFVHKVDMLTAFDGQKNIYDIPDTMQAFAHLQWNANNGNHHIEIAPISHTSTIDIIITFHQNPPESWCVHALVVARIDSTSSINNIR